MPAGQGDELELVAHRSQFLLECGDGGVVQCRLPVERRGAVVRQHLVRELGVDSVGEPTGLVQVGRARLAPDEVAVGRIGEAAGYGGGHPGLGVEEPLRGPPSGEERPVTVVHIARDKRRAQSVGTGDDDRRNAQHVGRQAGCCEGADVLLGRDEHLAAHVATLLFRSQLVLEVDAGSTCAQHPLH